MDALEQEMQRRGLMPQSADPLEAEMKRRGLVPEQPEQGMVSKAWGGIKSAVKGNAEFQDAGGVGDYIKALADSGHYDNQSFWSPEKDVFKDLNKVNDAGTFGNVDDQLKALLEVNPQADIKQDVNGNKYATLGDKKYYMNPPGLDVQDVSETIGEGLAYSAGGLGGSLLKGYGLLARMFGTGAAETGVNYAAQKMAGRDEVDKTEMAISGLAGGVFEGLTPVVSALWRKVKNSGVGDAQAGKAIAQRLGAGDLTEVQQKQLGNMVRNLDPDQVTPETILQHIELNQTPTLGSLTKNQDILDTEHLAKNSGRESTRKRFQMIDEANQTGLRNSMDTFQDTLSGGSKQTGDYYDAAQRIGDAVSAKAKEAKKGVSNAYDSVDDVYVGVNEFKNAPDRFKKAISNSNIVLDPSVTNNANAAIKDMQSSIAKLGDAKGVSWKAVEAQRQRINGLVSGSQSTDKKAMITIKNEYDNIVNDAFENEILSGSAESLSKLKDARGLAADYFKKFQSKEDGAKVIKKWVDKGVTPEKISNAFLSKTGVLGQNAPEVAKAYLNVVGRGSTEHNLLKELAIQRFTADKGRAEIRGKLTDAMKNGKTFMNEVFTPKELGFLSRTVEFIDSTTRKGDLGKSSGTTERAMRWLTKGAGNDASLSGMVNLFKKGLDMAVGGERRLFNLPTKQLKVNPLSGAASQATTSDYSNQ